MPTQATDLPKIPNDIWRIWTHTREDFQTFVQTLNSHHTSIKVEPQLHEREVNFLDTTIFKETGKLDSKLYIKPTDTHALLHRSSFHPKHIFSGILKLQIICFFRICTRTQDRDDAIKTLSTALRRGYSRQFIRRIQKTGHTSNRNNETKQKIPLIAFFPRLEQVTVRTLKQL